MAFRAQAWNSASAEAHVPATGDLPMAPGPAQGHTAPALRPDMGPSGAVGGHRSDASASAGNNRERSATGGHDEDTKMVIGIPAGPPAPRAREPARVRRPPGQGWGIPCTVRHALPRGVGRTGAHGGTGDAMRGGGSCRTLPAATDRVARGPGLRRLARTSSGNRGWRPWPGTFPQPSARLKPAAARGEIRAADGRPPVVLVAPHQRCRDTQAEGAALAACAAARGQHAIVPRLGSGLSQRPARAHGRRPPPQATGPPWHARLQQGQRDATRRHRCSARSPPAAACRSCGKLPNTRLGQRTVTPKRMAKNTANRYALAV
jgi:hypothetical protein